MSDAIRTLHDYLAKSPSVVYPQDVLEFLPAIEVENAKLRELVKHVISRYNDMNREYWGNQEPLPCDLCNMERQCSEVPQHDRCLFYEYLRELGVEVES